ncbi:energy transducer TonB [Aestuariibaculum lutulentum]|uniref:Energy transducer TonB n=1 Tax=Aestuariibaculum lutulentum TaxID=2920935 RepID=A0ABS9RJZ7_9FLAO|nr:energy transducer TonB [Aestuariibaculum lutulentum]MCH4553280.1 energy transducer TonB [Aestuariibaculum lutulentum]
MPDGVFQRVPVYPGCENSLANNGKKRCMSENVTAFVSQKYNTSFIKDIGLNGVQKIYVMFKIDKTGNVINIRAKAKHGGLEAEAIRVVSLLPRMKPGIVRGKLVTVPYSLPIGLAIRGN